MRASATAALASDWGALATGTVLKLVVSDDAPNQGFLLSLKKVAKCAKRFTLNPVLDAVGFWPNGKPPVNGKRVLRIMQANKLTLERHTGRRPGRTHDGVVIALRSNIRWCSDHFELACRNGEIVRVLFAIDACDREVMGWLATSAGISGEMVRDLMIACVERRFGISKAAHPVEWLSDNGSAYIAKDTLDTATALGLKLCFTPVRSPESNGIAEAFVKTFKRDYAWLSILPDAETVIALLPAWFEDYNEVHPHSGLKFLSPREFLRLSA